jgi:hypothetical protein
MNMKKITKKLMLLSLLMLSYISFGQKKIAFIGQAGTYNDDLHTVEFLPQGDTAAAIWFMEDFGVNTPNVTVNYFSFEDVAAGADLAVFDAIWIQYDPETFTGRLKDFPRSAPEEDGTKHSMLKETGFAWSRDPATDNPLEEAFILAVKNYYLAGGKILLGNYAGFGLEPFGVINSSYTNPWEYKPNQDFGDVTVNALTTPEAWGNWWGSNVSSALISSITTSSNSCNSSLPFIEFLASGSEKKNRVIQYNLDFGRIANDNPTATLSEKRNILENVLQAEILIENCTGNEIQGLKFNPTGFNSGKGTVVFYGSATYDWYVGAGGGNDNVKKLTKNTLLYLAGTTLSVDSIAGPLQISYYPNPVHSALQIQYEGDLNTTIFDSNGKKILNTTLKNIDMSNLPIGTYIAKSLDRITNQINTFKVIKK